MFLFIMGMGGFGAGRANPGVVFILATPIAFFALCFMSARGTFVGPAIHAVIISVILLTLPFFWYLIINGPAGLVGAAILGAFLFLWLLMCRSQLHSDARQHAPAGEPAPRVRG